MPVRPATTGAVVDFQTGSGAQHQSVSVFPGTGVEGIENLNAGIAPTAQGSVEHVVVILRRAVAVEKVLIGELSGKISGRECNRAGPWDAGPPSSPVA